MVVLFTIGCDGGGGGLAAGSVGGPCYGNGSCDSGLVCNASNTCESESSDACDGINCSGHGTCAVSGGEPLCACESGYHADGLNCVEDSSGDPCDGITCSGQGACAISGGSAVCVCNDGYHAEGVGCVENDPENPCEGVTCSSHGLCNDSSGSPVCDCDGGYHADGLACIADDPCEGVTCSEHGACVDSGGSPECDCDDGYSSDGLECLFDGPHDIRVGAVKQDDSGDVGWFSYIVDFTDNTVDRGSCSRRGNITDDSLRSFTVDFPECGLQELSCHNEHDVLVCEGTTTAYSNGDIVEDTLGLVSMDSFDPSTTHDLWVGAIRQDDSGDVGWFQYFLDFDDGTVDRGSCGNIGSITDDALSSFTVDFPECGLQELSCHEEHEVLVCEGITTAYSNGDIVEDTFGLLSVSSL